MFIPRSFLFSFNILWRLVLVMPFIILALLVFGLIGLIYFFIFALIFPALAALFVAVVVFASTSVIPTMVGTRLGLQARGVKAVNSYGGMFLPALGYGLFEGLIGLIIFTIGFGIFMLLSPLTMTELGNILQSQPDTAMDAIMAENPALGLGVIAFIGLAFMALRAALLVPMAGASIGRDANGSLHTPFMGFGTRFLSLFALVVIGYVISTFLWPVLAAVVIAAGQPDAFMVSIETAESGRGFDFTAIWFIGATVLIWLWVFSLQCAGGVLAYLNRQKIHEIFAEEEQRADRMDAEDLRNLWKSRMPPGRQ